MLELQTWPGHSINERPRCAADGAAQEVAQATFNQLCVQVLTRSLPVPSAASHMVSST